jgi:hypothetical protein
MAGYPRLAGRYSMLMARNSTVDSQFFHQWHHWTVIELLGGLVLYSELPGLNQLAI